MKRQALRKAILLLSFLAFPITINYLSPYLIIRGGFEGVLSGSGMLFASLLISSLLLGRAFCGWLCPAGALQDLCANINGKPVKRGANMFKYLIWVPWLFAIAFGFIKAGGLRQIDLIYFTDGGISVNAPAGYYIYFTVIALILALSFFLGRRGFCHSVCWMAPFMVLGDSLRQKLRLPGLYLKPEANKCISCNACNKACPMSLDVHAMVKTGCVKSSECILCASCADACPKKALKLAMMQNGERQSESPAVQIEAKRAS